MLSFLPLHLGALDWKSQLKPWILSWCGNISPTYLTHFDWFNAGHHPGCRVWQPPPVAADAALEQIAVSFHKRPLIQHIILIPCLFTATWRKLLGNICDFIFSVPLGASIWPTPHFEPLVVGLYFPLTDTSLGTYTEPLCWTTWHASCQVYQEMISIGEGIFCKNFSLTRGPWTPCH
jgi:hypothetical protein